jgi:hypothetical protein
MPLLGVMQMQDSAKVEPRDAKPFSSSGRNILLPPACRDAAGKVAQGLTTTREKAGARCKDLLAVPPIG